jgi:glycosyltransferase involved in cell wall biosynthesis
VVDDRRESRSSDAECGADPGQPREKIAAPDIDLSIVIPVHNEQEALSAVSEDVMSVVSKATFSCEVVLCDDGSTDRSLAMLHEWQGRHPETIRVVRHELNRGIAAAWETLFASARGKYVFCNASDGQWKTAECLRMMEIRDQYDLVIGVRRRKHYTLWRKVVSGSFNLLAWICFGVRTYDAGSIKLYKAEILKIPLTSRGVFAEAERIIRARRRDYRIGTIVVDCFPRTTGRATGADISVLGQAIADLLRCWWQIVVCRDR